MEDVSEMATYCDCHFLWSREIYITGDSPAVLCEVDQPSLVLLGVVIFLVRLRKLLRSLLLAIGIIWVPNKYLLQSSIGWGIVKLEIHLQLNPES